MLDERSYSNVVKGAARPPRTDLPSPIKPPYFPKFMELSGELRKLVYRFALVPDEPVELAPLYIDTRWWVSDTNVVNTSGDNQPLQDGFRLPYNYHFEKWEGLAKSVSLLRVSNQVYLEALPIFYGQEFRFTGIIGWPQLSRWLERIGHRNRAQVRHITVGHLTQFRQHPQDPFRHWGWWHRWAQSSFTHPFFTRPMSTGNGSSVPIRQAGFWK